MFLHPTTNLKYNPYCAYYPWHTHPDWNIWHCQEEKVYRHIWLAHDWFEIVQILNSRQVKHVVFWADMMLGLITAVWAGLVEDHLFLCACSMSADSLLSHFGKEDSCPFNFHQPQPGVFYSAASIFQCPGRPTPSFLTTWTPAQCL